MRVAFVISGLATGGAEMMLYKLLKSESAKRLEPLVISLGECDQPARLIESLGIRIIALGLQQRASRSVVRGALDGYRTVRRFQPELLSGWMYHGNVAAWLLARRLEAPLVWNIRQTLNLAQEKPLTQRVIRIGAYLSRAPKRLVYVSHHARAQHRALGYWDQNALVLPNGFDLEAFRRDAARGQRLRRELGISDGTCVIGHLARYHPMKDQVGLIGAARRVVAEEPAVMFLLAGHGLNGSNDALAAAVRSCGIEQHVRLLGQTDAPQAFLSACDLFCLPSAWGEGFPNSVGEAMACEVPCVVTRVGDAPDLVDSTGLVVETGDREALAQAVLQLVRSGGAARAVLGARARARIDERFSMPHVAGRYVEVFEEALSIGEVRKSS
jgi:glycosyltransferase involved in cell wall biosynthesis